MRTTQLSKLVLQALTLVLLPLAMTGALAEESFQRVNLHWGSASHQLDPRDAGQQKWVCEYMRAPDGVLYMYCEDLVSLMYDEPPPDDAARPSGAKYFPLWGTPKSDRNAVQLAEIILCGKGQCSVELAHTSDGMRIALY